MPADIEMAVFGAGAVGKSCICVQYIQGHFVNIYDPTVEDVYRKPTEVDGTIYVLTIVDTAGQDTVGPDLLPLSRVFPGACD